MALIDSYPQFVPPAVAPQTGTRRRSARHLTAASLTLALGLIGAGGYAALQLHNGGTLSPPPATSQPAPLTSRVLASSAIHGMVAVQQPAVLQSASQWATVVEKSSAPAQASARLQRLGFIGGATETLVALSPVTAQARSTVEQYHSAAGARAELSYQSTRLGGSQRTTFPVVGVPGARGVSTVLDGKISRTVMFATGPYFYFLGSSSPTNAHGAPTGTQLAAAADLLYLRINGCVAGTSQTHAS